MPTYEYQCSACGHQLEAFQKMSDPALTECPHCHQANLQKLVSAAGFQLKGTGWYVTDFRNKGKPDTATSNSAAGTSKAKEDKESSSGSTGGGTAE